MGLAAGSEPPRKGEAGGLCNYSSTYGESMAAAWAAWGGAPPYCEHPARRLGWRRRPRQLP